MRARFHICLIDWFYVVLELLKVKHLWRHYQVKKFRILQRLLSLQMKWNKLWSQRASFSRGKRVFGKNDLQNIVFYKIIRKRCNVMDISKHFLGNICEWKCFLKDYLDQKLRHPLEGNYCSPMGNVEPKYIKSKHSLTSVKCRERDHESLFLILINEPPKKGGPTKPEKILHVF